MFPLVGCHSLQGFSLVHAVLHRHSATVRAQQHRQQEMFPLVGCHSLKRFSLVRAVLRRYSSTVRVQQHRQQEMFPLVGCHLLQGFSLVHFCCAQVLCHSAGAAAQAARNVPIGLLPLTSRVLIGPFLFCAGTPRQCGRSSTGSKKCS
jgi:hypothetical protein